jgi:hypothetical protein
MATSALRPNTREIEKPKCRACGVDMWLIRIEPRLDCDVLTFECSRCDAAEKREAAPGHRTATSLPAGS